MSTLRNRHKRISASISKAANQGCHVDKSLMYLSLPKEGVSSSMTGIQQFRKSELLAAKEKFVTDAKSKYILVGYKGEWDIGKSFLEMKRLNVAGREVYGVFFTTVMPTEAFQILDSKLGWGCRFFKQGAGMEKVTHVLRGNENIGDGRFWYLADIKPGTEVSVYFAPSEETLTWELGPLDLNYDMPPPKKVLTLNDVTAVTQLEVDNSALSNIFLMATDPVARIAYPVFHLIPHIISLLTLLWIVKSAPEQTAVGFYKADTILEWLNFSLIYIANLLRKGSFVFEQWSTIQEALALANKIHGDDVLKRRLRFGAFFEFVNLLQDPFALILSLYVSLYMSDNVFLNVLLNIVALEFITEIDDEMTAAYSLWRYGEQSKISIAIIDISYGVNEGIDLWHATSNSSAEKVCKDLRKCEEPNSVRWELLASGSKGLGLLDTLDDGREIVSSFRLELDIVHWESMTEETIGSKAGLFLESTSESVWDHHISKSQRALLFKHYPEITSKFGWVGSIKLEHTRSYGVKHARALVDIVDQNEKVVAVNCWFDSRESDACAAVLKEGLMNNTTLETLSVNHSGLTPTGVMELAKLLRGNSTLKMMWLLSNKFGDAGALTLAEALSEGSDANTTLERIVLGVNNVSDECKFKCMQKTNGRMIFIPDENLAFYEAIPL